jgi:YegS/Rv2252/BmrU family lipid kinase
MRLTVIINPIAGRARRGIDREALARSLLAAHGLVADVAITGAAGHGRNLALAAIDRGVDRVVAWGGDGTVNEVAGPLIGSPVSLGIVPSGSGDGFARSLGLPHDPRRAFARAVTPERFAVDVGRLGDRHFLNVGGVGFDAAIACLFNARATRGALGYVTGGLRSVWSYDCDTYELEIDGNRLHGSRFLIAFANGRQYGNGIVIAPDASLTDGWLNAVIVSHGSPLRQFWRARRLAVGRLRPAEGIVRSRVQRAVISGPRLLCHVDGEPFEAMGELVVTVMPASLLVAGLTGRDP